MYPPYIFPNYPIPLPVIEPSSSEHVKDDVKGSSEEELDPKTHGTDKETMLPSDSFHPEEKPSSKTVRKTTPSPTITTLPSLMTPSITAGNNDSGGSNSGRKVSVSSSSVSSPKRPRISSGNSGHHYRGTSSPTFRQHSNNRNSKTWHQQPSSPNIGRGGGAGNFGLHQRQASRTYVPTTVNYENRYQKRHQPAHRGTFHRHGGGGHHSQQPPPPFADSRRQ